MLVGIQSLAEATVCIAPDESIHITGMPNTEGMYIAVPMAKSPIIMILFITVSLVRAYK
jgi:hypothetical protein